ncbi:cadherin-5 [Melanotaenia boesemani]|uniref:cadherin-5 n=1 Tax=Melanotaenia boesemani TaxID=1250792 RepID=UPI001C04C72F|nr:cadherin-5 [Melanotaenia boesemani]XP_041866188.1 cadherin-5 [Melanotaenia boesemani]
MMAWLQVWMKGLMASLALSYFAVIAQDNQLQGVTAERQHSGDIVKKESHPVLHRQKRAWVWNNLYVEEEKPAPIPYKIGQLESTLTAGVKKFEIDGDGANTIFTVDQKGDLFVTRSLDREKQARYNLTAKMYDGNGKLIENSGDFAVHVTDINDHSPVFPKQYNGSIVERSEIGTKVVEVIATDADDPTTANAELKYTLIDGHTLYENVPAFEIDSTGMISCKINTLDRETKSQYVVVVQAQDMRGMKSGSTATTSVTITITDTNDNVAYFTDRTYELHVPENRKLNEKIGTLKLEDRDEIQNKEPLLTIQSDYNKIFNFVLSPNKDGNLILRQPLDYETRNTYTFDVYVRENFMKLSFPADNLNSASTTAQVTIRVLDVDEPPVFTLPIYNFTVVEEQVVNKIGIVTATDPDKIKKSIRYSIIDEDCPISINPSTGQLSALRKLDREQKAKHTFEVEAQEEPSGLSSRVKVNIIVDDINDHPPELDVGDIFVCEKDNTNTVIGILKAADKDDQRATFTFKLASPSSNFSIRDYGNSTAAIVVKRGPFSLEDPNDYSMDVHISDGELNSVTKLAIKSCQCDARRTPTHCKAGARRMGVSVHALIAILLCILTILVIVILFVMRKRYQKDSLASMKNSGEIHEQLVTYDEEGGGEMDTNGYDVSILTSACNDGSLLRHPDHHPHPSLYAMVQKPHHHTQPTACKGDMAAMIEVKKDEADHDRDGFPYDTLHIYGYEGPESLAGSLSSLESSSTGSNLDYDFLNEWGPRFRALAELYGVDGSDYYNHY